MKVTEIFDYKLLKFLLVGIVNTLFGAGLMFLLYNIFNCTYWMSSICNYIFGGILSFFLNKYFTFKSSKKSLKEVILFIATLILCYLIAYVFAKWAIYHIFVAQTEKIKGNIAMLCGMCIYTGLNYIFQRLIVFNTNSKGEK